MVEEREVLEGKYVVVRPIGEGSSGCLYEAENLLLGKRVAVKTIHAHLVAPDGARERVLEVARATATLEHPNICGPMDLGESYEGTPYIVTEMLSGPSLREELDGSGPASVTTACDLILQVLAALDYAHANGLRHGGLHPGNVHVVYPRPGVPWVKVTDFGLARALEPELPSDVVGFLAPESDRLTAASDVYSTAALLFALVHGREPVPGESPPESAGVPATLNATLEAALHPDPDQRTPSAQALAGQLACHTLALSASGEYRLSLPVPSIRWVHASGSAPAPQLEVLSPRRAPAETAQESIGEAPEPEAAAPQAEAAAAALEPEPTTPEPANGEVTVLEAEVPQVTESLLRNPRFPSDHLSPWSKQWRKLRARVVSHPNLGAAWLLAVASLTLGVAFALLAAWL